MYLIHNPGTQFRQHLVLHGDEVAGNPPADCGAALPDSRVGWIAKCGLALCHYHKAMDRKNQKDHYGWMLKSLAL